jgi:hypothetical protein
MKKMNPIQLSLCLFIFLSIGLQAAGTISYTYDVAGNRISRTYKVLAAVQMKKQLEEPVPIEEEKVGDRTIRIYPNPTKGALGVEILGGDDKEKIRIQLYNMKGSQIQNLPVYSGLNTVNMFDCAAGMYVLRLVSEKETIEYKIIKE